MQQKNMKKITMKQNKLRLLSLGVLVSLATMLFGCAKPSLVGKWKGTQSVQSPMGNQQVDVSMEYKADGTFVQSATTKVGNIGAKGTYTVDGDKVTSSVSSIEAPPMIKSFVEPMLKKQINQTSTFKIEGDNVTLSKEGNSVSMTRVKE
jgi:uncharacterized protein (TIGR03066 family)